MKNKIFNDLRGTHMKFFQEMYAKEKGFNEVKEIFTTINNKGTVRAFHFQSEPKPQQKIIKALNGSFNVRVVNIKEKTIKEYNNLNKDSDPIFVGKNELLGYVSLEDNSIMLYIADEDFYGEYNAGVHPLSFEVDWAYQDNLIMSERDLRAEIVTFDNLNL